MMNYLPCAICGAETGLAEKDSCEHTCLGCEGTCMELNGLPCIECGGTGLRREFRNDLNASSNP